MSTLNTQTPTKPEVEDLARRPLTDHSQPIADQDLDKVAGGFNPQPDPPGKSKGFGQK